MKLKINLKAQNTVIFLEGVLCTNQHHENTLKNSRNSKTISDMFIKKYSYTSAN